MGSVMGQQGEFLTIISIEDQIAAVRREIAMRERVYDSWVRSGKMKRGKADYEIACMKAVLATLQEIEPPF